MRYLMKLRHKKGFTLTELIVVCAIIGILMVSLAAFSAPVRMMIKGVDAKSECLTISKTMGDYLEHMLAYANDVRIYAGVDISESGTLVEINKAFKSVQETWNMSDGKDRSAALIFHFETESDELKSTQRIYEISGRKSGSGSGVTAIPTALTNSNLLFYKDFYGPYSYFLAVDSGKSDNAMRQQSYLKLVLKAYYFDGTDMDGSSAKHISTDDIESYYKHLGDNTVTDKMEAYNTSLSAKEEVFFPLQNIKWTDSANYIRGDDSTSIKCGDDIVILYNVRTLNFKSS